jgi:predicted nucleotidyltransferase
VSDTAPYPSYDAIRRARSDARRRDAVDALMNAERIAQTAGARLVVFGSLVEGGFHGNSDIDVALLGSAPGPDLEAASRVETLLRLAGFSADVVPERFLSPSLRERIARVGKEPGALG